VYEELINQLSNFFLVPPPVVVVDDSISSLGEFIPPNRIVLRSDASPEVLFHEFAHYAHYHYGFNAPVEVWERYAKIFERGASKYLPTFICESCGSPIKPYALGYDGSVSVSEKFSCPTCKRKYEWRSVVNEDDVVGYVRVILDKPVEINWENFKKFVQERSGGEFIPIGYTKGEKTIIYGYSKGIAPLLIVAIVSAAITAVAIAFATGAVKIEDVQKMVTSAGMWAFLIAVTVIGGLIIYKALE
jgi:hypothetical protein